MTTEAPAEWGVPPELALLYAGLAQQSFTAFCILNGQDDYDLAPHIKLVHEHIEALERGDILKLMVFLPPQNSKSYHVSQRWPAWALGKHPRWNGALVSYGQDLASRNGRIVRGLLADDRWAFETKLLEDSRAAHRFQTSDGGGLMSVGVGGGLTGNPADFYVIDDPLKDRLEAESPLQRDKVWNHYTDVVLTRRAPHCRELITLTRWHDDDLPGRILNGPDAATWTVLSLPAIAEDWDDPLGRVPGEALWAARYPLEWLEGMRRVMAPRSFASLYQQNPVPYEGSTFRKPWFEHSWNVLPPDTLEPDGTKYRGRWTRVLSVDSAWDEGVGHDRSAVADWGTDAARFYLLNTWADQVEYPDLKTKIIEMVLAGRWWPTAIFVEDKANGRPLVQELRRTKLPPGSKLADGTDVSGRLLPVFPVTPKGSKPARAEATTPLFIQGVVLLPPPERAPWLSEWVDEHLRFPAGAHDDRVDTTSLALLQLAPHLAANIDGRIGMEYRDGPAPAAEDDEQRRRREWREAHGVKPRNEGSRPSRLR